ncbi:B12-binding domain-containing radical SAM protein [Jannaschia seosinensis]|nr:radical SAM protein [Jannaschia seosinensis]
MAATLRARGFAVKVICPLALDLPAAAREGQEQLWDHLHRRIRLSDYHFIKWLRNCAREPREWLAQRPRAAVLREVEAALSSGTDAVLLSAYLDHFHTVRGIGRLAERKGVPVLLGGPMFNLTGVAETWRTLPGVAAVSGGEVEPYLADLVEAICDGNKLARFPGLTFPDGTRTEAAPPLRALDDSYFPDFDDFPWDRYPNRIVPILAGRGCQWDKCTFCSDVISASGRKFRTRGLQSVLVEMQIQAERYGSKDFMFLDLKLNSHPAMFRGIARDLRRYVRGAQWVGTVHVDQRRDNGLSRHDLFAAASGGMRRISFGLESGSQRLLDAMRKGCSVERNEDFLRNAHDAGLSVRCTMFKGYPGETAEDMEATADFLERNSPFVDRIRFNDFMVPLDTPIHRALMEKSSDVEALRLTGMDSRRAKGLYDRRVVDRAYRRAKARALRTVYEINRRPLREMARQFDGLM